MNIKRFYSVFRARNLEFVRDRAAMAWNFLLPLLFVGGIGYALSGDSQNLYKVAVYGTEQGEMPAHAFFKTEYVSFLPVEAIEEAKAKVQRHQLDMLIDVSTESRYWVNTSSPKGYFLERALWGADATKADHSRFEKQKVEGKEVRYVDWLVPGILAMNMMFNCLFGVGYVVVRYRKNGVLKRLKATPLTPFEFILAQVLSRVLLVQLITVFIYFGCEYLLGFQMHGSYLHLLLISVLGSICLVSIGLLVASRITSEEFAGGLINLISWPMMLISGVWFSLEGVPEMMKLAAQALPLTHICHAARAIMIDGAGLVEVMPNVLALAAMSVFFLFLGSYLFRWER